MELLNLAFGLTREPSGTGDQSRPRSQLPTAHLGNPLLNREWGGGAGGRVGKGGRVGDLGWALSSLAPNTISIGRGMACTSEHF